MNTDFLQDEEKVFLSHNLLFPFVFDNKSSLKDLIDSILSAGWKGMESTGFIKDKSNYSQYVYYHSFIRKILFGGRRRGRDVVRQEGIKRGLVNGFTLKK